jgi:hypothetical protein
MRTPRGKLVFGWTGFTAVAVASAVALSGCTSPSPASSSPAAAPSSAAPEATSTPTATAVAIYPITGEPIPAGTTLTSSLASKIDNLSVARPQIGLQYTDEVFEELVEGGLTRYVAVWQSHIPKTYGPVRSIRGMDPYIVSPLGGMITYSGGQPYFVRRIQDTVVKNVSDDVYGGDSSLFHRIGTKSAPHNLVASGQNILKKFGSKIAPPAQQYSFASSVDKATASLVGTPTTTIKPTFSGVSHPTWKWSASKGVWLRFQSTGAKDTSDDGKQLRAVNVITMRVTLKTIKHTPVSQLIGTGKATVSTNGKTVTGTWTKATKKGKLRFVSDAGGPLVLAPGNTWIEIVPTGGSVSYK